MQKQTVESCQQELLWLLISQPAQQDGQNIPKQEEGFSEDSIVEQEMILIVLQEQEGVHLEVHKEMN